MATMRLKVDGTILPSPTAVGITDEQLWSESTGRSVSTGEMLGSVIATKRTLEVEWAYITAAEYDTIKTALTSGYFSDVEYEDSSGGDVVNMSKAYRGNISREDAGFIGSVHFYKSVKVSIIEK